MSCFYDKCCCSVLRNDFDVYNFERTGATNPQGRHQQPEDQSRYLHAPQCRPRAVKFYCVFSADESRRSHQWVELIPRWAHHIWVEGRDTQPSRVSSSSRETATAPNARQHHYNSSISSLRTETRTPVCSQRNTLLSQKTQTNSQIMSTSTRSMAS